MRLTTDDIFALLPAYMRLLDATEGQRVMGRVAPPGDPRPPEDFGPLRTLASLVAREAQVMDEAIDQLYADAFIETCAPWVIPYLGDLLGVRGLADVPEGIDMRARVADALALRARKGTLRALEQAAAEGSNLPVLAVEYWKRLVVTQSMRLTHPEMVATVNLRDKPALARIGQAYERNARTPELRRIDTPAKGRWMLGNIGLHVWRLRPYSLTLHQVQQVAAGRRDFRFHPLGCDAQLFDKLHPRPGLDVPVTERDLPAPISRAVMAEDPARFYGEDRAIRVFVNNVPIPASEIRAAHLGDLPGGGAEPPWNRTSLPNLTLIDPVLGRLVVGQNRPGPVRVICNFARVWDIGGGEQARSASIGSVENPVILDPLAAISAQITAAGGQGTFVLNQTTRYSAAGIIDVPNDGVLRVIASSGSFPTLRLSAGLTFQLGARARVELNGLRLHNSLVTFTGVAQNPGSVTLRDCTLVPGRGLLRNGDPRQPGALALAFAATGARLEMERVISGAIRIVSDAEAKLTDCIIDANSPANPAILAPANSARQSLSLTRCTVIGTTRTDVFAGGQSAAEDPLAAGGDSATTDTLFVSTAVPGVAATRRQLGCIRFSHVPPDALVPRLYRVTRSPAPTFTSLRYADADYLMFNPNTPDSLTRGAEGGGWIGAWNRAALTIRDDNIARSISDFLRFGHAGGIFHAT
ncbi:MAG: phage tail protein [Cypionkella sp.]